MLRFAGLKMFAGVPGAEIVARPRVNCEDGGAFKFEVKGITDESPESLAGLFSERGAKGSLSDATPKAGRGCSHSIELPKCEATGIAFLELYNSAPAAVADGAK